jgi:hypothetical protein
MGSANELEYHLLLAKDLRYLGESDYETVTAQVDEVKRMLSGLLQRVRTDVNASKTSRPVRDARSSKLEAQSSKLAARSSKLEAQS